MTGRARLFQLIARREAAATARAGRASAEARLRGEALRQSEARLQHLLAGMEPGGTLSAASLRDSSRLALDLAREADSLRARALAAEAEAEARRAEMQRHDLRRSLTEEAARAARRQAEEDAEARAEAARIPPRRSP